MVQLGALVCAGTQVNYIAAYLPGPALVAAFVSYGALIAGMVFLVATQMRFVFME